jgi:dihydrofolate reductase
LPSDKQAETKADAPAENEQKTRPGLISHIVAFSNNRVIGVNNEMPWHLPNDLKHFKKTTLNKPILMGRKTYDSIGKPLPKRRNLVLTRQQDLQIEGCEVVNSIAQAYELCKNDPELMIIGGADLYEQTLNDTERVYATLVDCDIDGDVYYPKIDLKNWKLINSEKHAQDEKHNYPYSYLQLDRKD